MTNIGYDVMNLTDLFLFYSLFAYNYFMLMGSVLEKLNRVILNHVCLILMARRNKAVFISV